MRRALAVLPENTLVGLITFGTQAHLHELGCTDISKVFVFRGTKEITKEQILDQLGLSGHRGQPKGVTPQPNGLPQRAGSVNRFLLPASECNYPLNAVRSLRSSLEILCSVFSL